MFSKDLQFNFSTIIHSCLFIFQGFCISELQCLDLKIDLPPQAGKTPVLYYNPIINHKPDSNNTARFKNKETENNHKLTRESNIKSENFDMQDIAKDFSSSIDKDHSNGRNRVMRDNANNYNKITETKIPSGNLEAFPYLSCLKNNVRFWERVYTEIDNHEAFLHDKRNLSRIYAILTLPTNKSQRTELVERHKAKYYKILYSISRKLHQPSYKWTSEELRVAKLFKKNELTQKYLFEAMDNLRIQTGLKTQFEAGIQRSINYLPSVFPIVKQSGLPLELALLPHVESSYNSLAGSKVGAMGLWQIMPGTMKMFEGERAVNKRTDPVVSTKVAMKILKSDFDKIQNWPLTLTAYNHGVNGMLRAIDETGSRDLCKVITHYNSSSFQFASSNFYAQFLAAKKASMQKYLLIAKRKKGESSLVLRNTLLSLNSGIAR
ncbi:MAG: lytic transglycosylase domain-containing protein [Spirobacillus cienkowskii]|jgi:membrane-bound lytic murein transglycosylase D|uniref:Lytic transglycosylase domain-containing protein n=1 Tax=Spirobacillus cienkowskii TaxID=495820 RepID=A0A369KX58_9BACT|nr:MAG: lytic transglycosylase domain-containing protein [Spirobacillus cienkowskii]